MYYPFVILQPTLREPMPYWRLYYHINWPTKNRAHLIDEQFENELFTYLNRKATAIKCHILAMGACPDHMHLIISIPPSAAVSDVIKRLKGSCSHDFPNLHWQHGYGVVSVSEKSLPAAIQYVKNQKQHHAEKNVYPAMERFEEGDD
jgi:putative transposase